MPMSATTRHPDRADRLTGAANYPSVRARLVACTLAALALQACGDGRPAGDSASSRATTAGLIVSTAADADALIPPLVATTAGKQVVDLLFDHLAAPKGTTVNTLGDVGFAPQLASAWRWAPDSLSIAFTINSAARWHDGTPVTAADVAFSFALYTDTAVASIHAGGFAGIDSVTAPETHTAVVWWSKRHPEQFFQIAYNLAVLPKHLLESAPRASLAESPFANKPVGSGRYRFESWERKRQLVLAADSGNYRGAPAFPRVLWTIAADPNAAANAVLAGQADVIEVLRGDAMARAATVADLATVEYPSLDYGYLAFNQRADRKSAALFRDRALRVALSAAVDRAATVRGALDSLGAVAEGPWVETGDAAVKAIHAPAYDTAAAARTLDSLGWKWNAKHTVRERAGKPLAFAMLVPASSGTRKKLAVVLQAQFAAIGVQAEVEAVEPAVFASRMQAGDFDTAINAWRNDPSPTSIRQAWGSARKEASGANFGRYANAAFDATLDSAIMTFDAPTRSARFARAYEMLVQDAPALWLYRPRNFAAVRSWLAPADVRADSWLGGVAGWSVKQAAIASR